MSMAASMSGEMEPREFRLRNFLIASVALHGLLFLSMLLTFGGIFGGPGPGGGQSVTFQLAAGSANDRYAAQPEPVKKPEEVKPEPPKPPEPKKETAVRKAAKPMPPPEEVQEPQPEAKPVPATAGGAGGDAEETILNKKGNSLTAGQIRAQMTGKTFVLEMGRIDIQGSSRYVETTIELHADGTTDVDLKHYFFQTYHRGSSTTRSESGEGTWWIEGNRWCHSSKAIQYGTKDCYDMTREGDIVRLYYAPCTFRSSQLCRTGHIAGEGRIQ